MYNDKYLYCINCKNLISEIKQIFIKNFAIVTKYYLQTNIILEFNYNFYYNIFHSDMSDFNVTSYRILINVTLWRTSLNP